MSIMVGMSGRDLPTNETTFDATGMTMRKTPFCADYNYTVEGSIKAIMAIIALDLAVRLANEKQYEYLRDRLIGMRRFIARRDNAYTLVFEYGRPVDLLPFGALSMEQSVSVAGQIRLDGFQEVYEAALSLSKSTTSLFGL